MTYCLPFLPPRTVEWNSVQPSTWSGTGITAELCTVGTSLSVPSSPSYGRVSQSKQECPGAPWPRWDGSSSREALSYRRSGSVPSLEPGTGLMAWDESLGMERQSSDKMVAQDSGVAAIAPEPLPPTAVTFQYPRRDTGSGHCSVSLSLEGLCPRPEVPEPRYIPTPDATMGLAVMRQLRATSPPMAAISTG